MLTAKCHTHCKGAGACHLRLRQHLVRLCMYVLSFLACQSGLRPQPLQQQGHEQQYETG